ncbi:MAG: alpha/beta hydrolase-fold protein, partial [Planctomycetota bacterium]
MSLFIFLGTCVWATSGWAQSTKKPAEFHWVNPLGKQAAATVKHKTFDSQLVGEPVGYAIQFPPNYAKTNERYPVVYLLHGGRPGGEHKMVGLSRSIAKEMRSEEVPAMIYVYVNGGPVSHYNVPGKEGAIGADVFIKELIPHIDKTYRTIADRKGRGLEGFSQGGRGTMRLSLRYPELF